MTNPRSIAILAGIISPTLFLILWSVDALLLVAEDVFIIALLQLILFVVFVWRFDEIPK
jgi:hypothetical protein